MKPSLFLVLAALLGPHLWAQTTPAEVQALLKSHPGTIILDVRTAAEYAEGHLDGALLQPFDSITATSATRHLPSKATPVVVYCRSGRRSALAAQTLKGLGYRTIYDLGAISRWPQPLVKGAAQ